MSKRAVIYARFSSSKQREASIDDQVRICTDWCASNGYEVVRVYSDYAMSGRTDEREQFQRMIANAGESDAVVVYMMDRFSRDPYDAPIYKKALKKAGVTVFSAMENIDQSPDGIIMEKLLEGLAARESMVTAIRTKRGMEGNAQKCLYNGDRVFGYSVDESRHYVVNEKEAAFVQEAFERRRNREAVNAIASDFATRGVTTYAGNPCSSTMVYNMLRNERYTGVYKWGDVRIDGGMPQIVDADTFKAVQSVRGRKQRKLETFHYYALSGKAICGPCGHNMVGASCKNHAGVRYDYYRCSSKCGARQVRRDIAEELIVSEIRKILNSDEAAVIAAAVEKAWNGTDRLSARNDALERLRKARSGIDNLIKAVEDGMPYSSVRSRMEELRQMEERAQKDYELHKNDGDFDTKDFIDFLRFGATLDDKSILDAFVSQVVVMDGSLAVTLNYDIEKNTPRRFEVCTDSEWLPRRELLHTTVTVRNGAVVVYIPFAA